MNVTLGIDLGAASILAASVDLDGRLVGQAVQSFEPGGAPAAAVSAVRAAGGVAGAVVGLATHNPRSSEAAAVRDALSASFRVPSGPTGLGEAAVVAEHWCGAARGAATAVCLLFGDHVAAGVLLDGRPWTGAHGLAGSTSWLALNPVERQDYRQHGCLDAEVSDRGIARRLAWRVQAGDLSRVVERAGGLEAVTAQHVFDGARDGDGVAISVVRDTVRYVAMAIANLCVVIDPEIVVLGALATGAEGLLLEPVRLECQRRVSPEIAEHLRIVSSPFGSAGAAVGAARLAALAAPQLS